MVKPPPTLNLSTVNDLRRAVRAYGGRWADRDKPVGGAIHNDTLYEGRVFVTREYELLDPGVPARYTVRLVALDDSGRYYTHHVVGARGAYDLAVLAHAAARRVAELAYLLPASLSLGTHDGDSDAVRIARLCDIPVTAAQVSW